MVKTNYKNDPLIYQKVPMQNCILQIWSFCFTNLQKWSLPISKFIEMVLMFHKTAEMVSAYYQIYIIGPYVSQNYKNMPCFLQKIQK